MINENEEHRSRTTPSHSAMIPLPGLQLQALPITDVVAFLPES